MNAPIGRLVNKCLEWEVLYLKEEYAQIRLSEARMIQGEPHKEI